MATGVVPEYLKIRVQDIHLRVPHQEAGTQGMTQNDHWTVLLPREFVIYPNPVGFDLHCVSNRVLFFQPKVKRRMDTCQRKIKSFGDDRRLNSTDFKTSLKRLPGFSRGLFFFLDNGKEAGYLESNTIGGYRMEPEKKEVLLRLRRIEGQIRGLQRMIEEGAPCADVLTQVAAATAAMKKVGTVIVKTYMEECLDKTQKGAGARREDALKDFQKAVSRYIDWA
jgi:DNA-binding FrmR family transcriptional regulator